MLLIKARKCRTFSMQFKCMQYAKRFHCTLIPLLDAIIHPAFANGLQLIFVGSCNFRFMCCCVHYEWNYNWVRKQRNAKTATKCIDARRISRLIAPAMPLVCNAHLNSTPFYLIFLTCGIFSPFCVLFSSRFSFSFSIFLLLTFYLLFRVIFCSQYFSYFFLNVFVFVTSSIEMNMIATQKMYFVSQYTQPH